MVCFGCMVFLGGMGLWGVLRLVAGLSGWRWGNGRGRGMRTFTQFVQSSKIVAHLFGIVQSSMYICIVDAIVIT